MLSIVSRRSAALLAICVGVLLVFFNGALADPEAGVNPMVQLDVYRYQDYANLISGGPIDNFFLGWGDIGALDKLMHPPTKNSSGMVPYRDFAIEYPPANLALIEAPRQLASSVHTYLIWFTLQMGLINLATLLLCMAIARHCGGSPDKLLKWALVGFLALGPIVNTRLDAGLSLLIVGTLTAAMFRRPVLCAALLATATAMKLFPLLLLPIFGLYWWHASGRSVTLHFLAAYTATCAVWFVPAALVGGDRFWVLFSFHSQRPVQIESTLGGLVMLWNIVRGTHTGFVNTFGSLNLDLSGMANLALNSLSSVLLLATVAAVVALYARMVRASAEADDEQRFAFLLRATAAVCVTIMATSKVFSTQYLVWILPWIFLLDDRRIPLTTVLACLLTQLVFPYGYQDLVQSHLWTVCAVVTRNALMFVVAWNLVRPWMRGAVRAREVVHGELHRDRQPKRSVVSELPPLPDPSACLLSRPSPRTQRWTATALFLASLFLYFHTATPTIGFGDSGETVAAGHLLGIPHPPGYPLYMMMVHAAQRLIPFGDLALRTNLLSCVLAAATVAVVYLISLSMCGTQLGALLAASTWAVSATFWFYAHFAKVYALSMLFFSMCWCVLTRHPRRLALFSALLGLGMAAHYQTLVIFIPAFTYLICASYGVKAGGWMAAATTACMFVLAFLSGPSMADNLRNAASLVIAAPLVGALWWAARDRAPATLSNGISLRTAFTMLCVFIPGWLFYLYLPVRAAAHPAINWDNPSNWMRFWHCFRIEDFAALHGLSGLPDTLHRLGILSPVTGYAQTLAHQYLYGLGLILAAFGLWRLFVTQRALFHATLIGFLLNVVWVVLYFKTPIDRYTAGVLEGFYLPSNMLVALWIGMGGTYVAARMSLAFERQRMVAFALALSLLALPALSLSSLWHENNRAQDRFAEDYGYNALSTAAPNAMILSQGDDGTFPLWYWQYARGYRTDVTVVFVECLSEAWYREQLSQHIVVPSSAALSMQRGMGDDRPDAASVAVRLVTSNLGSRPVYADYYAHRIIAGASPPQAKEIPSACEGVLFRYGVASVDERHLQDLLEHTYRLDGVFDRTRFKDEVTCNALLAYTFALDTLGIECAKHNDETDAIRYWEKAVDAVPTQETNARTLLADHYLKTKDFARARAELEAVARVEPRHPALEELVRKLQVAVASATPVTAASPPPPPPSPDAKASVPSPTASPSTPPETPKASQRGFPSWAKRVPAAEEATRLNQMGISALFSQPPDPATAMRDWIAAAKADPHYAEPHANLGNLLLRDRQFAAALREYDTALRLNPSLHAVHFNRGLAYEKMADIAHAIEEYKRELALGPDPRNPMAWQRAQERLQVLGAH